MTASRGPVYVLGVLALVNAFNHLDRHVFGVLIEPIKADLRLSDTSVGFLGGLSFAIFHTVAGLPIARWADRGSRRLIISIGVLVWSAATAASGLARSFAHLALARIVTGIGEASNGPASHSMISDYFPLQRRATALAIFGLGASVGIALGYLLGGWIADRLGWRAAFFILGAPGVFLALLVWMTVREPERGAAEVGAIDTEAVPLHRVVEFLRTNRAFSLVILAQGVHAFSGVGLMVWTAPLLMRLHGLTVAEAGMWIGPIAGVSGVLGMLAGGRLGDHLGARDTRWYLWLPALVALVGLPFSLGFIMSGSAALALVCLVPHMFFSGLSSGPVAAVIQGMVPVRMRALGASLNLIAMNLVGTGLGPQMVGLLSDAFRTLGTGAALRYAMLLVAVANLLAGLLYLRASRALGAAGARVA